MACMNKYIFFNLFYLFATLSLSLPVSATPAGVYVKTAKNLDTPGLYLVNFTVIWPQGIPGEDLVTNKFIDYTYRVYCPTGMVRNVTKGKWKEAQLGWNNHSIGTGVLDSVLNQVCP
jgi:hypothetical protein